jgi:hypothetical protein
LIKVDVSKGFSRRSKGYDGSAVTSHRIGDLLSRALEKIGQYHQLRPEIVLAAWPDIIGPKLAPMTRAVSFHDGLLVVKVNNSTLYSLLCQDKGPLLGRLRQKFPSLAIKDVVFRIG